MKDFRNLVVWQDAHQLTLSVYRLTKDFPKEEWYGLRSQIRRCCESIPANIAEGCGRRGNGEFHRFLQIASGSASELDYHLLLSHELQYIDNSAYQSLCDHLGRTRRRLSTLIARVEKDRLTAKCQLPTANG